jgi:hypothetical protein
MDGDVIHLSSVHKSIAFVQEYYRSHVKNDQTTDEFLAERRAEAAHENSRTE